jgi:rhomboid family GlyGly-CTERM serine protease
MIHTATGREGAKAPSRFPYLAAGLSTMAFAAIVVPNLGDAWQLERDAVRAGEAWRVLTCHLTHWSADHFVWDVLTFAVLGALCESWSRTRFAVATMAGALAISASVWLGLPELHTYRGLSGIDCALFALLATLLIRERRATPAATIGSLLLAAAFLKVTYELVTGTTLFVDGAAGVTPLPLAHVAGGLTGIAVGLWPKNAAAAKSKSAKMLRAGMGAEPNEARADAYRPLSMRWPRGFLE